MAEITLNLVPQGDGGGFHVPNLPGSDSRRVAAQSPNQSSPLSMKIKIAEEHHGKMTYEGETVDASLIIVDIRFLSSEEARRYRSVSVYAEFFDKTRMSRLDPVVVAVAPEKKHWLNETSYDRTTKYGANIDAGVGSELASIGVGTHWEAESTKPQKFKATLTGRSCFSEEGYHVDENAVKWTMEENKDLADGVPSFLQAAVLLKRTSADPFVARFRATSKVDFASMMRRMFSSTTDRDKIIDDITLTPSRPQTRSSSLTGIKEDDLEHMERLLHRVRKYFRVNLREEALPLVCPESNISPPPGFPSAEKDLHTLSTAAESTSGRLVTGGPTTRMMAVVAVARAAEASARAAEASAHASEAVAKAVEAMQRLLEPSE